MTREEKRNKAAEKVCQEVRYQISDFGAIIDNRRLFKFLEKWMKVAKKNRYERPEAKE